MEDFSINPKKRDMNDMMLKLVRETGHPIYIYGTGGGAKKAYEFFKTNGTEIVAFSDRPEFFNMGDRLEGKPIIDVKELLVSEEEIVLCVASMDTKLYKYINKCKHIFFCSYFVRNNHYEMTADWVSKNEEAINKVYNCLGDDLSKKTFLSYIDARANCIESDMINLPISFCLSQQYFNDLYPKDRFGEHVLVDCGAYTGDTAASFIDFIDDGKTVKVCAFEADMKNYDSLTKESKTHKGIIPYPFAVGDREQVLYIEGDGQSFSKLVDYETEHSITVKKLDDVLLKEGIVPTYIKMDIEGSEIPALNGATELIKKYMPMLGICVYHKLDDLITIPNFIFELQRNSTSGKEYKYYLRQHSYGTDELVFYAVPTGK